MNTTEANGGGRESGRERAPKAAMTRRAGAAGLLATILLAGLSACTLPEAKPDPTRYYVLTPTLAQAAAPVGGAPRVFVRAVAVPEFLRGRIMQVRVGDNELRFVDDARWAEPLEAGVLRVVRENLGRLGTVRVVDRGGEAHDFEIAVSVHRCEGVRPGGVARLTARIDVFSQELDPKLLAQEEFTAEIPGWDGEQHGELAKKLSEAAGALSERIARLVPGAR